MNTIQVTYEPTPNPQTLKFVINQKLLDEPIHFSDAMAAEDSPLAMKLFGFPWTAEVMIGGDFITVTKQDWVDWEMLADPLSQLLKEHLESGEALLFRDPSGASETEVDENETPIVRDIKRVLDREIRPMVAMDGGDIVFHKYEDNIVYIYMRGACSGCPSSTLTLKSGIEVRLKEAFPEIKEVISL